jgi:carbonic anhydrase
VFIDEGEHSSAFDVIWNNLPTEPSEHRILEHVLMNIDDALPLEHGEWRYRGSLTTPPCTEGVHWVVMKKPIEFDAEQIARFEAIFSGNNRPTQPSHGRSVVGDLLAVD